MKSILIVLMFAGLALADDAPKSPAAVAAEKQYESASVKARTAYLQSMIVADKKLVTDLDAALKVTMRGGNIDEADRVKALKADAQSKLESHQGELKNPKGGDEAGTADAPVSGDVLTFAAILSKMPKELKPVGEYWDQKALVKANEWISSNISGKEISLVGIMLKITPVGDDTGRGEFQLAEDRFIHIGVDLSDKSAFLRAIKLKDGQRTKIKGILETLRFTSAKAGDLTLRSAEIE